jgi:hypothetical protein
MIEVIRVVIEVGVAIEIVVSAIEVVRGPVEIVAIDDGCAVGDVGVVVIHHVMVMPVRSPVVPSPAVAAKKADSETQAKGNAGSRDV